MGKLAIWNRLRGTGEIILLVYLVCVIGIALLRVLTGWPTIEQLASSPVLLAHGQWWRLVTSAFIINGPPMPQLAAIAVLGSLTIYVGGSWLFWRTALAGHVLGTLVAYVGFGVVWLMHWAVVSRLLIDPDYGVSLIWCAALGAFMALAWFGEDGSWRRPARPGLALLALATVVLVTMYSDDMAAVQHAVAFVVGFVIIATSGRARVLHRERRPILPPKARALRR